MKEEFDFESIKNKAIEQLKAGKPLLGKDGAFAPLLESILNAALEGEMDAHLTEEERQMGNRRNGKMQKQVQTPLGEVTVSTPRDRNSSFDPQFIKKRETILAEGRKSWESCFGRHNQFHHRPCTSGDKSMEITDA